MLICTAWPPSSLNGRCAPGGNVSGRFTGPVSVERVGRPISLSSIGEVPICTLIYGIHICTWQSPSSLSGEDQWKVFSRTSTIWVLEVADICHGDVVREEEAGGCGFVAAAVEAEAPGLGGLQTLYWWIRFCCFQMLLVNVGVCTLLCREAHPPTSLVPCR